MSDYTLGDTLFFNFTTRSFTTGVPTALAGTPVISIYEDNSTTQITAGITLIASLDGVAGLNNIAVVATGGNGFETGRFYSMVITTGTVGGVSVVGEVVGSFSLESSAAAQDLANGTDGLGAIKADTAATLVDTTEIGVAGAGLTNINLPDQTMNITGNLTGNVTGSVGSVTGGATAAALAIVDTNVDSVLVDTGTTIPAQIAALNDFNPATDTVANVTLVATTTTNSDMRGTDSANTVVPPSVAQFDARTLLAASYFDPTTDVVANVTLVATTTTNTDMRGTDSALLAANVPTNFSALGISVGGAIDNVTLVATTTANTDMRGTDGANTVVPPSVAQFNARTILAADYFDPSTDTVANVTLVATTTTNTDMVGTDNALLAANVPTNFSSMVISVAGAVDGLVQGFINTTLTESSAARINDNFEFFYNNADAQTTQTVDDVGGGGGGGTDWTASERTEIRGRLGITGATAAGGNTPTLSLQSSIDALNDFNSATDTVANVTLVATTTTNSDMRGTDNAALATAVAALNDFDPTTDPVANVTLVATTTTNTDMVGTNNAFLAASAPGNFSALGISAGGAIDNVTLNATTTTNSDMRGTDGANVVVPPTVAQLDARTLLAANYFDPAADTVANVTLVATTTLNTDMRGTDGANTTTPPTAAAISTEVWTETVRTLTAFGFAASVNVATVNGATVLGNGTDLNLWRG